MGLNAYDYENDYSSYVTPVKYEAPKYEAPKYEAPKYEAPKYEAPKYEKPSYEPYSLASSYKKPKKSYKKPSYKLPKYSYNPTFSVPDVAPVKYDAPSVKQASLVAVPDVVERELEACNPYSKPAFMNSPYADKTNLRQLDLLNLPCWYTERYGDNVETYVEPANKACYSCDTEKGEEYVAPKQTYGDYSEYVTPVKYDNCDSCGYGGCNTCSYKAPSYSSYSAPSYGGYGGYGYGSYTAQGTPSPYDTLHAYGLGSSYKTQTPLYSRSAHVTPVGYY